MNTKDKIYVTLCSLFSVLVVISSIVYQKFILFQVLSLYTFEVSAGAIIYPFTFLLTNLISEFYGKKRASFCLNLALTISILISLLIAVIDGLNATEWSNVDNITFHRVFGLYSISLVASIMACYISQRIDITIYLWIRKITRGRWLLFGSNVSTSIALFIDTLIVISLIWLCDALPIDSIGLLVVNSYLFKVILILCSTPLFYLGVKIIRTVSETEERNPYCI